MLHKKTNSMRRDRKTPILFVVPEICLGEGKRVKSPLNALNGSIQVCNMNKREK